MAATGVAPISIALEGVHESGAVPTQALLAAMLKASEKVSDLIFSPGRPPQVEVYGQLVPVQMEGLSALSADDTRRIAADLIGNNKQAINTLREQGSCDISYGLPGLARFRVNAFIQRGSCAVVMRVIPTEIPEFDTLHLPAHLGDELFPEPDFALPAMRPGEHVVEDYRRLSLSLKAHPVAFMRRRLEARGMIASAALDKAPSGRRVTIAGLVLVRQRPGTAKGVIFMTLEDEQGVANIIVWPKAFERLRPIVIGARFVAVTGKLQNEAGVIHIIAERMEDLTPMLGLLSERGPSLATLAPADEVRRPQLSMAEKRRGNRATQTPLLDVAQNPDVEERAALRAMPGGRNFH